MTIFSRIFPNIVEYKNAKSSILTTILMNAIKFFDQYEKLFIQKQHLLRTISMD